MKNIAIFLLRSLGGMIMVALFFYLLVLPFPFSWNPMDMPDKILIPVRILIYWFGIMLGVVVKWPKILCYTKNNTED